MKPAEFLPKVTESQWQRMDARERALQIAADLCDRIKVREEGGNNKGYWIGRILNSVRLGQGYAWCAACIEFCNQKAGLDLGPNGVLAAAVRRWVEWAKREGRIVAVPERGDLGYWLNSDGTGHIFRIVRVEGEYVHTIEGNTGPGDAGNQRDGDGIYRRKRLMSKLGFISLRSP